jgi:hypothetical protein
VRVFVRLDTDSNTAELEDEAGNEVTAAELSVEYDGPFVLVGPLDLAEGDEPE